MEGVNVLDDVSEEENFGFGVAGAHCFRICVTD